MFRVSSRARFAVWCLWLVPIAHTQTPSNDESAPLVLVRIIPMPDV